jgi:hypothetical protein
MGMRRNQKVSKRESSRPKRDELAGPASKPSNQPLDLGLDDLLATPIESSSSRALEGTVPDSRKEELPAPLEPPSPPPQSPYALLADRGDWAAIARGCEEEGLRTPISRVWWVRAQLERGAMSPSLLRTSFDRALADEESGNATDVGDWGDERREVLAACRRWFPPEGSSSGVVEQRDQAGRVDALKVKDGDRRSPKESSRAEVRDGGFSEGTVASADREKGTRWRTIRRAAIGLTPFFVLIGIAVAILLVPLRHRHIELAKPAAIEPPLPSVSLEIRVGELVPLTALEVLHDAMEELVQPHSRLEQSSPPPGAKLEQVVSTGESQESELAKRIEAPRKKTAGTESLNMDVPFEPQSVRVLRARPEVDPRSRTRSEGDLAPLPSVWNRGSSGPGNNISPLREGVTGRPDFFDEFDDHPGHPVERFRTPQRCELERSVVIRSRPSELAPVLANLDEGDEVLIEEQMGPWVKLQGRSGRPGYARATCRREESAPGGFGAMGREGEGESESESEWRNPSRRRRRGMP